MLLPCQSCTLLSAWKIDKWFQIGLKSLCLTTTVLSQTLSHRQMNRKKQDTTSYGNHIWSSFTNSPSVSLCMWFNEGWFGFRLSRTLWIVNQLQKSRICMDPYCADNSSWPGLNWSWHSAAPYTAFLQQVGGNKHPTNSCFVCFGLCWKHWDGMSPRVPWLWGSCQREMVLRWPAATRKVRRCQDRGT